MEIQNDGKQKPINPQKRKIITSANNNDLAERIKASSARIMKKNAKLYKALENK
ncbi:hypothetical protein [Pectinatus brassicae]|uniref:Uncharacterized protein n=1 Tax=Pectinatus brassicae TaxID=862415 RepID=A0A840UPX8_9FIRM|nr:hypothetical protein [Pectinatus brassicae]MBB5336252.1 hypothetical protein [Pectinatus brassicae]